MKKITRRAIVLYCLPLFAVGLFTTMLNNYLIYFYQPTAASGLPILITQGYVLAGILTVIGLIKAVGHVIDAVSDPMVAALSDKSGHRGGRRIPFLRWWGSSCCSSPRWSSGRGTMSAPCGPPRR